MVVRAPEPDADVASRPRPPAGAISERAALASGVGRATIETARIGTPAHGPLDLPILLGRAPSPAEQVAWTAMSPSLRERAAARLALLSRWFEDRGALTIEEAALLAEVKPKRFYQMASAWRKQPGLAAVGAYASAPLERKPRIDVRVNAALQAVVGRVVAAAPEGASTEAVRRLVEMAARLRLSREEGSDDLVMPSLNVVRAIVERERHRQREKRMLGDSVAGDCCATTMLDPVGRPRALFCLIDRATRRILGHALGSVEDGTAGYRAAAARALAAIGPDGADRRWAPTCTQMNIVRGLDDDAWTSVVERVRAAGYRQFQPIIRDRRFGSEFRAYVGDRVGRVVLRPTWTIHPPADPPGERFGDDAADVRVASEVAGYNAGLPEERRGGGEAPPPDLVAMLRLVAE